MIEPDHNQLSIMRQCELLGLARASYYRNACAAAESEENLNLMSLIDEEYTRHPFYGSRKMRDYLRRQGHEVNRKRVQRLMRKMGIRSVAPGPNTSKPCPEHKVYMTDSPKPNLRSPPTCQYMQISVSKYASDNNGIKLNP